MMYPLYRKRINDKHFYKVNSEDSFTELQVMGEKVFSFDFEAKIYPDKVLVKSLIDLSDQGIVGISEADYELIQAKLK